MAVSGYLSAELAATCNALGFYDGQKYHLEPHCKETVRDLIRYLRRDEGGSHEIRRYLGNAKLLTTDLLPMVQCHHKDVALFDIALRLIVNLTNPALLVYNEVIPKDKFEHNYYLEIVSHLQHYKEAFNDHKVWTPFTERLSELLGKDVEDRSEDDQRTIERILILIRNVLHVPSSSDMDQRPDNDASIHDQVLWGLHQSGMIDLLLYISSSAKESLFFMHLLEIICLMLREQPPELLAKTASKRSAEEKNRDDEALLKIRQLELENKMKKNKRFFGNRHSNFGGTYVIKNMKSTSDNNDLIYHKPIHDSKYISLDAEKKPVKLPKNRQPLKCESAERKSALSVRLILKQVCVEFLNAAYNPLMLHVRECFHRGKAQENDESYYFTAMRFFMEFNRNYNFKVKYVSETMSVQTFQFIQKYLETWHDLMTTDKKKLPLWSYRSHLALRAYKELLHNLMLMDRSSDESVRESSKVIKSNIFYVLEYREMLLMLVNLYKREKYSKKYLVDLLETIHIFVKLLCDYCKDKKMVIQKTAGRRKKSNKQQKSKKEAQDQASAETIWNLTCDQVALTLTSDIDCDVVPFDATLELDMDQQKLEAIKKIQSHLKNGDHKPAVAMLRASREVWPENDTFGTTTADSNEELEILKDIFLADLGNDSSAVTMTEEAQGSDEEEEDYYPQILEQNFDVISFLKRFCSPKVVNICNILLSTYDTNSETTNHCIVRMLHRIAWECKLPAMLFQASLFIKFRNILSNYEPKHKELAKLAVYIVRKFTEVAATNKTVFVELLFPKQVKDACEIVDGYGTYQDSKNKRITWEEHEEEELRRLDEEYVRNNIKENKVDWILDNLINKERSRKGVMNKMRELGLEIPKTKPKGFWEDEELDELKKLYDESDKDLPDKLLVAWIHERMTNKEHNERSVKKKLYELGLLQPPVKKLKTWSSEQDEELTEMFDEYKNGDDIMGPIMAVLGSVRTRNNVVGALLRLGLVNDKSQLKKKSKSNRKSKSNQDQSESESEDSDDSDDEDDPRSSSNVEKPPPLGPAAATFFRELPKTKYLLGGLKWLLGALNDCLEDLGTDDNEDDIPLLPLAEEPVLSMEDPIFLNFLHAFGFKKPIPNQEVYWRVAADWKETDIKIRTDALNYLVDNVEMEINDIADALNKKLSAIAGGRVDILDSGSGDVLDESPENTENFNSIVEQECRKVLDAEKKNSARRKRRVDDFVMEEGDGNESALENQENGRQRINGRRRFSSESDVDDPGSPDGSVGVSAEAQDVGSPGRSEKMEPGDEVSPGRRPNRKSSAVRALDSDSDGSPIRGTSIVKPSSRKSRALSSDDEEQEVRSPSRSEKMESGDEVSPGRRANKKLSAPRALDSDNDGSPIRGTSIVKPSSRKSRALSSDDEEQGTRSPARSEKIESGDEVSPGRRANKKLSAPRALDSDNDGSPIRGTSIVKPSSRKIRALSSDDEEQGTRSPARSEKIEPGDEVSPGRRANKKLSAPRALDSDNDGSPIRQNGVFKPTTSRKSRALSSDDEAQDVRSPGCSDDDVSPGRRTRRKPSAAWMLDSDSDNDESRLMESGKAEVPHRTSAKRKLSTSSNSDSPTASRKKFILDSSDNETQAPGKDLPSQHSNSPASQKQPAAANEVEPMQANFEPDDSSQHDPGLSQ